MLKAIKKFLKNLYSHKKPINPFISFWENFNYLISFQYCLNMTKKIQEHREKLFWQGYHEHPPIFTKYEMDEIIKNDYSPIRQ